MQRAIKFRAWCPKFGGMHYDTEEIHYDKMEGGLQGFSESGFEYAKEDITWMQFTGLHDKNGKEIWEGDILGREKGFSGGHLAVVEFGDAEFRGRNPERDDEKHPTNVRYFLQVPIPYSVIGNVWENPDLLNP